MLFCFQAHHEEDLKYKDVKVELKSDIDKLRTQVLDMIKVNATLPDIERLDRFEFNLDLDERAKLLGIREEQIQAVCYLLVLQAFLVQFEIVDSRRILVPPVGHLC